MILGSFKKANIGLPAIEDASEINNIILKSFNDVCKKRKINLNLNKYDKVIDIIKLWTKELPEKLDMLKVAKTNKHEKKIIKIMNKKLESILPFAKQLETEYKISGKKGVVKQCINELEKEFNEHLKNNNIKQFLKKINDKMSYMKSVSDKACFALSIVLKSL